MTADAQAIFKAHLGRDLPGSIEGIVEEKLRGLSPLERTKARPLDEETLGWAALSKPEAYRAIGRGEIEIERASVAPRRNGRRGASKIFVTLESLARFRAARTIAAAASIEKAGG